MSDIEKQAGTEMGQAAQGVKSAVRDEIPPAAVINRPEDLDDAGLSDFLIDIYHRISVHHTLWFREVEHQLGFERALEVMDEAWANTRKIAVRRLEEEFGQSVHEPENPGVIDKGTAGKNCAPENRLAIETVKKLKNEATLGKRDTEAASEKAIKPEDVPSFIYCMSRSDKLRGIDMLAKDWLAQDGVWFQAVEKRYGMNDAKRCNDSTWGRFSPFEAHAIKKFLGLGEQPGLAGLERALNFRIYGRLNVQSARYDTDGSLVFTMNDCRVQSARKRKHMADYPCKSAGLVEYTSFASAIDSRIRTACICCPPDEHPEDYFCGWRFFMPEADKM